MGHILDSIPEGNGDIEMKQFIAEHITKYWPRVIRQYAGNNWLAVQKWDDKYMKEKMGSVLVRAEKTVRGEVVEPYR